ncbi:MAG: hypothetical protein ACE5GZ_06885 [Gammaproteobacteria bacterium]
MNTPAHTFVNLVVLGRKASGKYVIPVVLGSVLPDIPMFIFYFVEKVIRGTPEKVIWHESYFHPLWQNLFDLFHSVPLIGLGLIGAWLAKSRVFLYLLGSMLLHIAFDFPLHHSDAHRHLFPFSNWRFESPASYWDPAYFGNIMGPMEALAVIICCIVLLRRHRSATGRFAISGLASVYVAYIYFTFSVWG